MITRAERKKPSYAWFSTSIVVIIVRIQYQVIVTFALRTSLREFKTGQSKTRLKQNQGIRNPLLKYSKKVVMSRDVTRGITQRGVIKKKFFFDLKLLRTGLAYLGSMPC